MSLSYTRMQMWDECQWRYFLTYVLEEWTAPSQHLVLGDAVHLTLRQIGDTMIAAHVTPSAAEIQGWFDYHRAACLQRADPKGLISEHAGWIAVRGTAILAAFQREVLPSYHPAEVEHEFAITINDVIFRGIIDALLTVNDGEHLLLDFKTGKVYPKDRLQTDRQMTGYLYSEQQRIGHSMVPTSAAYVFFPPCEHPEQHPDLPADHCHAAVLEVTRTPEQIAAFVAAVPQVAAEMEEALVSGMYSYTINPARCPWCNVYWSCSYARRERRIIPRVPTRPR